MKQDEETNMKKQNYNQHNTDKYNLFHPLGKKGQLDFLGHIQRSVSQFLQSAPKPLKYILFLLILSFLGIIISWTLNLGGLFCNSAGQPLTVEFNPISTVQLLFSQPREEFIDALTLQPHSSCLLEAGNGGEFVDSSGTTVPVSAGTTFYDGGRRCNTCDVIDLTLFDDGGDITERTTVCQGDATPKPPIQQGFWEKTVCVEDFDKTFFLIGSCQVPTNYKYESTTQKYECTDASACSTNTIQKTWDKRLNDKGAKLLYASGEPSQDEVAFDQLFIITCSDINRPRLTIKGIDIFNLKIWMFFSLIFLIFWAWRNVIK